MVNSPEKLLLYRTFHLHVAVGEASHLHHSSGGAFDAIQVAPFAANEKKDPEREI